LFRIRRDVPKDNCAQLRFRDQPRRAVFAKAAYAAKATVRLHGGKPGGSDSARIHQGIEAAMVSRASGQVGNAFVFVEFGVEIIGVGVMESNVVHRAANRAARYGLP
jgi:hypothetical protein